MNRTYIITKKEFYRIAPIMSKEIDWEKEILPILDNVMQLEIKQQIPDYFLEFVSWLKSREKESCYRKLWYGGKYEECGKEYIFEGMIHAFVNYVFAHLIKRQNSYMSQIGYRQFTDTYSSMTEQKKIESDYQYYKQIGDSYMVDCIKFLTISCKKCNAIFGKRTQFLTVIES